MYVAKNNADTAIIVVHEIYGINDHIRHVVKNLSKFHVDVFVPNLLKHQDVFAYEQEQKAYQYFMNYIGFDNAFEQVKQVLDEARFHYRNVYVLGYSIGATIAWLCGQSELCDLAVGFYGSRIRDYTSLTPKCPTLLFFPDEEPSFEVSSLVKQLSQVPLVMVKKIAGKHGFANPYSQQYNHNSSIIAYRETLLFLKKYQISVRRQ